MLHAEINTKKVLSFIAFSLFFFLPFFWLFIFVKKKYIWEMIKKMIEFYSYENTKNNNKHMCWATPKLINSALCYFWDDWWWCTHDVKVSMKVLIKNLFFVWKKMSPLLCLVLLFLHCHPATMGKLNIYVKHYSIIVAGLFHEKRT